MACCTTLPFSFHSVGRVLGDGPWGMAYVCLAKILSTYSLHWQQLHLVPAGLYTTVETTAELRRIWFIWVGVFVKAQDGIRVTLSWVLLVETHLPDARAGARAAQVAEHVWVLPSGKRGRKAFKLPQMKSRGKVPRDLFQSISSVCHAWSTPSVTVISARECFFLHC